jgi:hypothetical protein
MVFLHRNGLGLSADVVEARERTGKGGRGEREGVAEPGL